MLFAFVLLFVVEYVAADAPPAEIANATKATTDAHNIVERFIIYFLPGVDRQCDCSPFGATHQQLSSELAAIQKGPLSNPKGTTVLDDPSKPAGTQNCANY
jgi:hypothetical protein